MASSLRPLRPLRSKALNRKGRKGRGKVRKDKIQTRRIRLPERFLPDFHSAKNRIFYFRSLPRLKSGGKIPARSRNYPPPVMPVAPNALHPVVDSLHSIDFEDDKTPRFLLTIKMKGVKTTSFFDSF
jgi:hypothetical protein